MRKAILAILIAIAMLMSFAACTPTTDEPQGTDPATTEDATQGGRPVITKAPTAEKETVTPTPDVPTPDTNGILGEDTAGQGVELPWQQ